MVSALTSRSSALVSSPARGHCVVFLGKILNFHSTSLHQMYKWILGNLMLGVAL